MFVNIPWLFFQGAEHLLLSTSNVSIYQRVFKSASFIEEKDLMLKVVAGEYAFIYFKSSLDFRVATQFTTANGETNLHVASDEHFPGGGYAWAFPKVSTYDKQ